MTDDRQLAFDFNAPLPTLPQLWTPDDIFQSCDQATIERFSEDSRVERKRGEVNQRDLAEYLSMWANTQPAGGVVFIGVANDGSVPGCRHIDTAHVNRIETVGRLCPDAKHEFKRIPVRNKKNEDDYVIVLRVYYRADKLVETTDGNAFVREGDEKRRLTETEKREIRLSKGELSVELEDVPLSYPDDFNITIMNNFRDQYISKRRLEPRYTIEDVLLMSRLGRREGGVFKPNLACAILFAKDARVVVPGSFIRVMRYEGTEEQFGQRLNMIADQMFEGPLPYQIMEAERYIESQVRNFTRLGKDGRFVTSAEYPKDVWLEAVVNAAVHRSYNLRQMNIYVKMFEDKMVIESPGAFMPPTTADTVYDAHNPRNPYLMWGLYYFDFVQCAFEGTRRMREGMRAANLPDPKFVQKQIGTFQVSVTLENDHEHRKLYVRAEAASGINPDIYESLSESEKMIVNYLADRDKVNVKDAGLVIARDWRETKKVLEGLEEKGVIDRSPGKSRSRHRFYFLKRKVKK